jgi:transposase
MTEPELGIDISKLKFNVCLINSQGKLRHKLFPNTSPSFCIRRAIGSASSTRQPSKPLPQAALSRTKTDRVDAELIARFCQAQAPPAWTPLPQEVRELQAFVRKLESLIEMCVMEENRLSSGITLEVVRESVEEHLSHLTEQIKRAEELIRHHINNHPTLRQQSELLDSIPGIAETTAALLLSELPDLKQYRSARQVAAYAGLVPREQQSGTSLRGRTRLSKIGNARLRRALYFPAITALRCSPFFQSWAKGLQERGKCKVSVICAVMRKLVHLAYGVLKSEQPFDPQWMKIA